VCCGMVGRVSHALRRRSSSTATCCFVRRAGTELRVESVGMTRRPAATEAAGACQSQEVRVRCAGHVEISPVPPGLMPEPIGKRTAGVTPQRTLSQAEQRRQSRPVTSKRCAATLSCRRSVGSSNVCFVFRVDHVDQPEFRFKPGQAVDVFVPLGGGGGPSGQFETKPGSYSIASTPKRLAETGEIELIIKRGGRGVPTRWLHDTAVVGDMVELCAVGAFHYSSVAEDGPGPLLLIAGGLGINPLLSILANTHEMALAAEPGPAITLLYSASCVEELTHKSQIEAIAASGVPDVKVVFTLTENDTKSKAMQDHVGEVIDLEGCSDLDSSTEGSEGDSGAADAVEMRRGRIDAALIRNAIGGLTRRQIAAQLVTTGTAAAPDGHIADVTAASVVSEMRCYICGPPGMIEGAAALVDEQGLQDTNIHFEKWW
jgi:ferredoxin-NADP reductase